MGRARRDFLANTRIKIELKGAVDIHRIIVPKIDYPCDYVV